MFTTWSTGIESVFALFLVLLSVHVHPTDTPLLNGDPVLDATFTLSTSADVPPLAAITLVVVQITGFDPLALHDQPAVVDPLNVNPTGNVSVTVTVPVEAAFPLLVTV